MLHKLPVRLALIILPILILFFLSVFILSLGEAAAFFTGVFYIATAMNEHAGLNIWLARALAAPLVFAGYYFGIRYILFEKQKRILGYLALIAVWSLSCLSMFFLQGSFSRATGEALRYYFQDDYGQIVLRDNSGVDADTGKPLQPVTPDVIQLYRLQKQGTLGITDETLFDPLTGKPLKRYYQGKDGKIELFPLEVQYHPQTGAKLEIMTHEIAQQIRQQQTVGTKLKQAAYHLPETFKQSVRKLQQWKFALMDLVLQDESNTQTVQFDPASKEWVTLYTNPFGHPVQVKVKAEGMIRQGSWSTHDPYNTGWKYGWELMSGESLKPVSGPKDPQYAYMHILSMSSARERFVNIAEQAKTIYGDLVPVVERKFLPLIAPLSVTLQPGQSLRVIWNDKLDEMEDNQGPVTFTITILNRS